MVPKEWESTARSCVIFFEGPARGQPFHMTGPCSPWACAASENHVRMTAQFSEALEDMRVSRMAWRVTFETCVIGSSTPH